MRTMVSSEPADRIATDILLWGGVVGPIGFVVVFLVEGAVRSGYDPVRLAVSYLSLGDGGWVQVATFLVTGILVLGFAVGVRRALLGGLGATGVPVAIALAGAGLVIAGVFSTMPAFGYPPGTPDGFPSDIPATAYLHVMGALLFFGGLVAAPLLLARRLRADGARGCGPRFGCDGGHRARLLRGVIGRPKRRAVLPDRRRPPPTRRDRRGPRLACVARAVVAAPSRAHRRVARNRREGRGCAAILGRRRDQRD